MRVSNKLRWTQLAPAYPAVIILVLREHFSCHSKDRVDFIHFEIVEIRVYHLECAQLKFLVFAGKHAVKSSLLECAVQCAVELFTFLVACFNEP